MSDSEFDNYLALLSRLLRLGSHQRDAIAGELRAHLEDRLDDLLAGGVPRAQAVRQALEEFGDAAGLAAEFVSISRNKRRRWIMRLTTASVAATILIAAGIVTFWPGSNAGPGRATVVAQVPGGFGAPSEARPSAQLSSLEDKLNRRTNADFLETPLKDAIDFLGTQSGIQIIIKAKRLEEAGVALDQAVTLHLQNVRLSTLLDVMLEDMNLVYTEKDDLIVITTPDDAQATMEVRVYDCRDLLTMPTAAHAMGMGMPGMGMPGMGMPGMGMPGMPSYGPPDPRGGAGAPPRSEGFVPAAADPFAAPEALADPNRRDPFAPPEALADPKPSLPALPAPLPRAEREVLPQAGGYGGAAPAAGRRASAGMASGGMPGGGMMGGGGMGGEGMSGGSSSRQQRPLSEQDLKSEQLMDIVTTAVDPDTWSEMGGPGTIGQYNGLLVVSQSVRTHTKIEKVLDMLRDAAGLPKSKNPRVVR